MGTGNCMVYAPETLTYDDDGKAIVNEPVCDGPDAVRAAVEACPTQALAIVGDPMRSEA
jgi:ferredoxin